VVVDHHVDGRSLRLRAATTTRRGLGGLGAMRRLFHHIRPPLKHASSHDAQKTYLWPEKERNPSKKSRTPCMQSLKANQKPKIIFQSILIKTLLITARLRLFRVYEPFLHVLYRNIHRGLVRG
jgi:hypothetical protein